MKNQYRGRNCLKRGAWTVFRFKGWGMASKRGVVFLRECWYPNAHYGFLAVLNWRPLNPESSILTTRPLLLESITPLLQCSSSKHFLWSRVGFHYRADKKYQNYLGKVCFKGQIQADSFLVELIFILLSHISQGDSWITCELDYMLLF